MSTADATSRQQLGQMVLGRYRVVRTLASGGMGEVFLARNEGAAGFVKPVVIKRSLRSGGELVDQLFAREARILSSVRHPGVVSIVDFAEQDGNYVMVLDYVHGYTLQQWSRFLRKTGRTVPVELAIYVVSKMLEALHYAHCLRGSDGKPLGIVHRDIKPSNVLIDVQGLVKLADFGVARTNTEVTDTSTGDSTLKGTFAYMAPELFSKADPSPASDVYSAAVTLYQLLAGRNPFLTNDAVLTAARALRHDPEPLDEVRDDLPDGLADAVSKGMCKHPEGRYQSARDLRAAMLAICPGADDADEPFRATIEGDFHDPRLPELLEIDSLKEREDAWSRYGDPEELPNRALPLPAEDGGRTELQSPTDHDAPPTQTMAGGVHTADTVLLGARPRTQPQAPVDTTDRKRSRLIPMIVAGAVAAAGVAAFIMLRGGEDDSETSAGEPTVVMVRGDVTMDDSPQPSPPDPDDPASAEPSSADTPPDPATDPAPTPVTKSRPPTKTSRAQELTSQFRRRQHLITRCFDRYPEQAEAAGSLAVRFAVDSTGKVARAELEPRTIEGGALGACLLEVARNTEFGAQPEPLSFRIPIKVTSQ